MDNLTCFSALKSRWDDYYPKLGDKTITILGKDDQGLPITSGRIRAELIYPYQDHPLFGQVQLIPELDGAFDNNGEARIRLSAQEIAPPLDNDFNTGLEQIEIKFTYLDNQGQIRGSIQAAWKVRNNSNVKFREVQAGEAVFVFDDQPGPNHAGITPANVTEDGERYFDFVQELLNQVVSRKRSVGNLYTLLDENGIFNRDLENPGNNTLQALYYLKEHFKIDNTSNAQWDFTKLMRDYNIPEADYLTWTNKIVDKRTLAGDTLCIEGQQLDNLINPNMNKGDTGLYELYVNVVKRFVDRMILEAERYSGQVNASGNDIPTQNWYARTGEGPQNSANPHGPGMSYCFGGKNSISQFSNGNNGVANCQTPDPSQSQRFTLYYRQNNQVKTIQNKRLINIDMANPTNVDDAYEGNLNENGCIFTGDKKYPGSIDYEYYSWSYGNGNFYRNYNAATNQLSIPWPAFQKFNQEHWAGIDCSGLVQRSADSARNDAPGMNIAIPAPDGWIGSGDFFTNEAITKTISLPPDDSEANKQERNRIQKWARKGDLLSYGNPIGHISIVYSDRSQMIGNEVRYRIIHAYGTPEYTYPAYDPIRPNQKLFSRKVIITWQDISTLIDFGRIKLWN